MTNKIPRAHDWQIITHNSIIFPRASKWITDSENWFFAFIISPNKEVRPYRKRLQIFFFIWIVVGLMAFKLLREYAISDDSFARCTNAHCDSKELRYQWLRTFSFARTPNKTQIQKEKWEVLSVGFRWNVLFIEPIIICYSENDKLKFWNSLFFIWSALLHSSRVLTPLSCGSEWKCHYV